MVSAIPLYRCSRRALTSEPESIRKYGRYHRPIVEAVVFWLNE
jgi:hypothetical protein